jgi:hypothetical protein
MRNQKCEGYVTISGMELIYGLVTANGRQVARGREMKIARILEQAYIRAHTNPNLNEDFTQKVGSPE